MDTQLPAELVFGGLAIQGESSAKYDAATHVCSNNYCHGPATPTWTRPRTEAEACGSCHGLPPPAPHPQAQDCSACHAKVIDSARHWVDGSLHVNGKVDVSVAGCTGCHGTPPPKPHPQSSACNECHGTVVDAQMNFVDEKLHRNGKTDLTIDCSSCHGSSSNAAPPKDLEGNSAPTAAGVGTHQIHLSGGGRANPVACEDCHVVPAQWDAPNHIDGWDGAELAFSGIASSHGATGSFDASALTCTNTWCHGMGHGTSPSWTNATELGCDGCHGFPPPAPHVQSTTCSQCHPNVNAAGDGFIDPTLHVDGKVQLATACNTCHGNANNAAPPKDVSGNVDSSAPGVGAHQAHLDGAGRSRPVACSTCHVVPTAVDDPNHIDGSAELTFSSTAITEGASPSFDPNTLTCTNTWCHGLGSGSSPTWTSTGPLACDACHGFPPPAPHVQSTTCSQCHPNVNATGDGFIDPTLHVNGTVDLATACNSCHGSAANAAPPKDLLGDTATSAPGVGAHQKHVVGAGRAALVACSTCHQVPASSTAPGHIDATPGGELSFTGTAVANGSSPIYTAAGQTCTNTWCHGLGAGTSPTWTSPTTLGCTGCHGFPPPAPHVQLDTCENCHTNYDGAGGFVDPSLHVNGTVNVVTGCVACHGSGSQPAPPKDLSGGLTNTSPGVGAHSAHLNGGGGRSVPVTCDECHVVPTSIESPGHIDGWDRAELTFKSNSVIDAFAGADGYAPPGAPTYDAATQTCTNTWCHGQDLGTPSPTWTTTGPLPCNGCHAMPPPLSQGHPNNTNCVLCHSSVVDAAKNIIDPTLHINGTVDF